MTWTAPASNGGSAITGYVVTPYNGRHGPDGPDLQLDGHHRDGDRPGQQHRLHLHGGRHQRRGHRGGQSAASNSVTTPTAPGAPTIGTATCGNVSATVTWTAPASNGGAAITGYVVTPYKAGVAQAAQTFNSTATTETATGLTNGTAYTFTVAAINGVGTGAASRPQSNSVTPATVPGAPTIGTATCGNASATVSWTAPASNGGRPITGYVVTPYIAGVAQTAQTFNSTATTETVTGLTNGTAYTFTVAAINRSAPAASRPRPTRSPRPPHRGRPPSARPPPATPRPR